MMDSGVKQKLTTETRRVSSGFGGDGWWTLWLCGEGVLEENRRDAEGAEEEAAAGVGTGALSGANHRDTESAEKSRRPGSGTGGRLRTDAARFPALLQ